MMSSLYVRNECQGRPGYSLRSSNQEFNPVNLAILPTLTDCELNTLPETYLSLLLSSSYPCEWLILRFFPMQTAFHV